MTSGTSDIDVFTNNETGRVTVDGSLMIRKKLNNMGSIINNTDFNLHPNNQNSSASWNNTGTITTNGTLSINSFVAFNSTGVIEGSGEHIASGQWTNRGTVSPGNSPGKLTHNGQYYESGKLLIEIGGTTPESEYDVLEIGNNRSHTILTSTLEVQLLNGFNPSDGDFFTILTASARIGEFSTLDLPELDPGLEWEVEYNAMDITLRVAAIVVPVTWLDFTVSEDERNVGSAILFWSTAEEINNLGFEIERSADGRNWEQIGFQEAQTKNANQYDYEFIDLNPNRGINYYRLKQMDYDGQHEYSEVRTIEMESDESSISVYPNPSSTGDLNLSLEKEAQGIQGVIILDLNGRIVHSQKTDADRGNRLISITVPDLSPGTYIIKLQGENNYSQLKWVKL